MSWGGRYMVKGDFQGVFHIILYYVICLLCVYKQYNLCYSYNVTVNHVLSPSSALSP